MNKKIKIDEFRKHKVSLYKNAFDTSKETQTIEEIIESLFTDSENAENHLRYIQYLIHNGTDENKKRELKSRLKAATFSASFIPLSKNEILSPKKLKNNKISHIDLYSNFMVIDVDHLDNKEEFNEVWNRLKEDKHTLFQFLSPSMNGIKVIVSFMDYNKVFPSLSTDKMKNETKEWHSTVVFPTIQQYYEDKLKIKIDPACKDFNRLTFLPYLNWADKTKDQIKKFFKIEELYYKREGIYSERFVIKETAKIKKYKEIRKLQQLKESGKEPALEELLKWCKENKKHIFNLEKKKSGVFSEWIKFCWALNKFFKDHKNCDELCIHYIKEFTLLDVDYDFDSSVSSFDEYEIEKRFINQKENFDSHRSLNLKKYTIEAYKKGFNFSDNNLYKEWLSYKNSDLISIMIDKEIEILKDIRTRRVFVNYPKENWYLKDWGEVCFTLEYEMDGEINGNLRSDTFRNVKNNLHYVKEIDTLHQLYEDMLKKESKEEFDKFIESVHKVSDSKYTYKDIEDMIKLWSLSSIDGHLLSNKKYSDRIKVKTKIKKELERMNKFIFVLIGDQNTRKTTSINDFLSPFNRKDLLGTSFSWTNNDDDKRQLVQNAFIFDDEISAGTKKEIETIKNITGNSIVNWVPKFIEDNQRSTRIASFISATNDDTVYSDLTGNVRFICLTIKDVLSLESIDFEKVWGYLYKIWLDGQTGWEYGESETIKRISKLSEENSDKSMNESIIENYFEKTDEYNYTYAQLVDWMYKYKNIKTKESVLGKIVRKLNFKSKRKKINGQSKIYVNMKPKSKIDEYSFISTNN
jgi:hypothetical protein